MLKTAAAHMPVISGTVIKTSGLFMIFPCFSFFYFFRGFHPYVLPHFFICFFAYSLYINELSGIFKPPVFPPVIYYPFSVNTSYTGQFLKCFTRGAVDINGDFFGSNFYIFNFLIIRKSGFYNYAGRRRDYYRKKDYFFFFSKFAHKNPSFLSEKIHYYN